VSRPPRDPAGATSERVTIRLTKRERLVLERMAAERGTTTSGVLLGFLEAEAPRGVRDAKAVLPLGDRCRWDPKHVWTPHRIPGTAWTLVVRRRVLGRVSGGDALAVEFGHGRSFEVLAERLEADGAAVSWRGRDGWTPAVQVFDHAPTTEELNLWWYARGDWRRFVRHMAEGRARVYVVDVDDGEGPAHQGWWAVSEWSASSDRHDVEVCGHWVDAFELCMRGFVVLPWSRRRVVPRPLNDGQLEELGRSPWAAERRAARAAERRAARAAEEARRRRQAADEKARREREEETRRRVEDYLRSGAFMVPTAELAALGLDEGCTELDVTRARKRAAIEHHPDRGGDLEAMKRANHAADVVLRWVRGRAA
jgi:hypothetical protein